MTQTMPDFRHARCRCSPAGNSNAVVDTVLPMSELVRAHEMVDERTHFGKVILVERLEAEVSEQ